MEEMIKLIEDYLKELRLHGYRLDDIEKNLQDINYKIEILESKIKENV